MKIIKLFEAERETGICQCYKNCDCRATTKTMYILKYMRPNGTTRHKEFTSIEERQNFITKYKLI